MQSSATVVLQPSTTKIATGVAANHWNATEVAWAADIIMVVSAASGTSPTLIVALQKGYYAPATGDTTIGSKTTGTLTWIDQWAFTSVAAAGTRQLSIGVSGSTFEGAVTTNSIASNTQHAGPLGDLFRIAWQIGGTNPSFTFSVTGKFYF